MTCEFRLHICERCGINGNVYIILLTPNQLMSTLLSFPLKFLTLVGIYTE